MDIATFAADRKGRLDASDDFLKDFVEDALTRLAAGDADWDDDLVDAATEVWVQEFHAEAPGASEAAARLRFRRRLRETLAKTGAPDSDVSQAQVDRITYWLSGYSVNSGTTQGAFRRGIRFKMWVTMHDDDVRTIHQPLDGQIRPIGSTFDVAGSKLGFPGEPVGPPEAWINCRCVSMPASREGEVMSTNTYAIDSDQEVEDENPDIVVGEKAPVMAAAVVDPTDIAVEPADESELEDEDIITEMPVHGVIAPEGVETGDGRRFALGALSTRELPIPLRVEIMSTHGGTTSDVVTIGRVDEAWRNDETDMWEYRGSIVLSKPYAAETIESIVDGTARGVSLDGDKAQVQREDSIEDINGDELLELLSTPEVTTFSAMRVAGLTIVPIPAFQEAYVALGHEFERDLSDEDRAVLAACGCDSAGAAGLAGFRDYSPEERDKMAEDGRALPDGSYPIADCEDLSNAIQAIGRASDPEAAKAHITKRKSDLGCEEIELPETWGLSADAAFAPGTKDGPGWITHPSATARIRRYWVRGEGAAKIAWGTPGDFNRCRAQLVKYVQNPEWLAGLCANMHKEALGIWPAEHHSSKPVEGAPALIASGHKPSAYPAEWFQAPQLDKAQGLTIEGDRIYGYLAEFGVCHIGITGICRDAPRSPSNYSYFLKGVVDTDAGEQRVGTLTYGIGHANPSMRAAAATAHYDRTDAVRAFVNVGEDSRGIWFAGVLAPWATEEDAMALRAIGALSGDWRDWGRGLELVGAVAVNTPGFQLAASGMMGTNVMVSAPKPEPKTVLASGRQLNEEEIGSIARLAIEEYRHQEKVAATFGPARERIRAHRLAAARARLED